MAYAAITSLMNTIQQSMELTGLTLQSFYEKLESLRAIMEKSLEVIGDADIEVLTSLEAKIAALAYRAGDMVSSESRKIFASKNEITRRLDIWELRFHLKQQIGEIDSTLNEWMAMQSRYTNITKDFKAHNSSLAAIPEQHTLELVMVGHENEFEMMQDQLIRGESELEVVSIVGMGGIGKTTLANKVYSDPFIMSRFDLRAKATVSQEYCAKNVLVGLLYSITGKTDEKQDDGKLADQLQKILKGGRYLVVIDDIWTKGAWDDIKLCFPDCNNGSRILMTTRNMELAEYARSGKPPFQMRFLNFDESWNLLYEKVFVKQNFPPEFEQLGKQIALKCRGLPLSIVVVAGILSRIGKTLDEWKSVAENVTSAVSTDVDVQCMRVLALSYHHLPHHLKSCFLYFAIFPEDKIVSVSKIKRLWVAEGFLKEDEMKSIEQVAEESINDLIHRNLITSRFSFDGKIATCGMHDMIRELCLKEARNTNFVEVISTNNDRNSCGQSMHFPLGSGGRISIQSYRFPLAKVRDNEVRSMFHFSTYLGRDIIEKMVNFKLLRVLALDTVKLADPSLPIFILKLIHLRYLALDVFADLSRRNSTILVPPSIARLHYLQTLHLKNKRYSSMPNRFRLPMEIFDMLHLRHLCLDWNYITHFNSSEKSCDLKTFNWNYTSNFVSGDRSLVLKNLQHLSGWNPLYCDRSFFRLLPKLKKLQICGSEKDYWRSCQKNSLHDIRYLDQLEELSFRVDMTFQEHNPYNSPDTFRARYSQNLFLPPPNAFPQYLKKMTFSGEFFLPWKDLSIVGKLPKLEALKIEYNPFKGDEWEVIEQGFPSLKFLQLGFLNIRYWRASSDHFPCLQILTILGCKYLDSIPQDFAEITTLEVIDTSGCVESVGNSAKQIQQDIEDNYASFVEVRIS